jgi:hypothetical protein
MGLMKMMDERLKRWRKKERHSSIPLATLACTRTVKLMAMPKPLPTTAAPLVGNTPLGP